MDDYWNTGWDPHQALLQCEQNIMQCATGINNGSEIIKDLGGKYRHQQEVIQQLQFNNRKLQQMVDAMQHQMLQQTAQIELLKFQIKQ
jgi:cytolysin (calcineurin-like family phosphatase)